MPIGGSLAGGAKVGDEAVLRDARGRRRRIAITRVDDGAVEGLLERTTYFAAGAPLALRRDGRVVGEDSVGDLPAVGAHIEVRGGDVLRIRRGSEPGRPATIDERGAVVEPASVPCELETIFDAVAAGDRVLLDDGAIDTVVEHTGEGWFDVVVHRPRRAKIKSEKGINLPDTVIESPALTAGDRAALAALVGVADLVSLSFVRSVADLEDLREELRRHGRPELPIGIKVEHARGLELLPHLLLAGLHGPPLTVMLARGDLAIEIGFERLAEAQEDVLCLCEAAHVPVIWATQVAESMAKEGVPTRAEVTDAASASRAECVMLNKGAHIADAMRFVDDVFTRMRAHQDKRTPLLHPLSLPDPLTPSQLRRG